jgi:exosome complex RNA-binding protein Rrp42 (RNase PH superfamily)
MLRPIPRALLVDIATIKVCTGLDMWQKPTFQEYTVSNVHIQSTNEVKKTKENTEVVLRSVLFIDGTIIVLPVTGLYFVLLGPFHISLK